jgi:prephenate dehydrogenase
MLEMIRESIDETDRQIIELLARRSALSRSAGKTKSSKGLQIIDETREANVIDGIIRLARKRLLDEEYVREIYSIILRNSREIQQKEQFENNYLTKEVGLIGFGRFGKLIAKHLAGRFRIYAFDKNFAEGEKWGAIPCSLEEACGKEIVVLCVPISDLESTLGQIKGLVKENALVMDVCSVKETPAYLMEKILPKSVRILATHPLFGQDSAAESLAGRKIALCKVRIPDDDYLRIKKFFLGLGLEVIETTPLEHDQQAAKSLLLTQLIGRALVEMGAKEQKIDTIGYKNLLKLRVIASNDSEQLFVDMNRFNRFSKKTRNELIESLNKIEETLEANC